MKRKVSTTPSRIWTFGCLPPIDNADLVREQMRLTHDFKNDRKKLLAEKRRLYREARRAFGNVAQLEDEYEALLHQLGEARGQKREQNKVESDLVNSPELVCEIKAIKKRVAQAYAKMKAEQKRVEKDNAALEAESKEYNKDYLAKTRALRPNSGIKCGLYMPAEQDITAAAAGRMDPKPRRWEGKGSIGHQLQGGLSVEDLFSGKSNQLQMDPVPDDTWTLKNGKPQRTSLKAGRSLVRIRVDSLGKDGEPTKGGRIPVWATLPIILHRPLPEDALIRMARLKVTREGSRLRYELHLTLESETFQTIVEGDNFICMDMGWRYMDPNMRVLYSIDSDGKGKAWELPAALLDKFKKKDELHAIGQLHFNAMRDEFREWLKSPESAEAPAWVREDAKYIAQWKSPARLAKLAGRWSRELFPTPPRPKKPRDNDAAQLAQFKAQFKAWKATVGGRAYVVYKSWEAAKQKGHAPSSLWLTSKGRTDPIEQMVLKLECWRRKNRHLYQWERGSEQRAIRGRNAIYRRWAYQITSEYGAVVLENLNLKEMGSRPEAEEERQTIAGYNRKIAALGQFIGFLKDKGAERVVRVGAAYSTKRCHLCGHIDKKWDDPAADSHTCSRCGETWDRDANAAWNLRQRYERRLAKQAAEIADNARSAA